MAGFNEGGHAIHARDAECAPVSVRAEDCSDCSAQGLTRPGGGLDYNPPGRRVAGSPGRRVAGRDSCAFIVAPPRAIRLPA